MRVGGQPHKTPHFHPFTAPPSRNGPPKKNLGRLNRLGTGVGRFRSCLYKWDMTLRPVSVGQKKKPSTMLSFNVQSIDLPMDSMG